MAHDRCDCLHNLDTGGTCPDHGDALPGQIVLVLPSSGMELDAFELVEPRPVRIAW